MPDDWKINRSVSLDTLLTFVVLLATIVGMYVNLTNRLTAIETRLSPVWARFVGEKPSGDQR